MTVFPKSDVDLDVNSGQALLLRAFRDPLELCSHRTGFRPLSLLSTAEYYGRSRWMRFQLLLHTQMRDCADINSRIVSTGEFIGRKNGSLTIQSSRRLRTSQIRGDSAPVQSLDCGIIRHAAFQNLNTIAEDLAVPIVFGKTPCGHCTFGTDHTPLGYHHRKTDRSRANVRFSSCGLLSRVSLGCCPLCSNFLAAYYPKLPKKPTGDSHDPHQLRLRSTSNGKDANGDGAAIMRTRDAQTQIS
jgi:hypothetical protein